MDSLLIYLFKTTFCLAFFYGLYMLVLRKETFFGFNRIYLLTSLLASFIIPLIRMEMFTRTGGEIPVMIINLAPEYIPVISTQSEAIVTGNGFSWSSLLLILYFIVSFLIITRLLLQYFRLRKVDKKEFSIINEGIKVVFTDGTSGPFSLFRTIYMGSASRLGSGFDDIIKHERAHIQYMHFIDLVIVELSIAFFWLNPFVWFYSKILRENHEYQADRSVLINKDDSKQYIALLINQVTGAEVFRLANTFSKSLTKKRMIMMTKKVSKNSSVLKALLAIPLLVLMLMAFTKGNTIQGHSESPVLVKGMVIDSEDNGPLPGAAILIKGTTNGTTSDMEGRFELETDQPDAVLVISFVGYKTQALKVSKEAIEVKMERKRFLIEPGNAPEKVSVPENPLDEKEMGDGVSYIVDSLPHIQGYTFNTASKVIQKNLSYPESAKDKRLEGTVHVQFTVDAKGKVKNASVIKTSDKVFNKEALKAVYMMPEWTPGRQYGKPVAVDFIVPVEFKLD